MATAQVVLLLELPLEHWLQEGCAKETQLGLCLQVSPNCALYNVKGFVNQSEPFVNNETVIFVAAGGNIVDACGAPFNTSVVQVSQPHR